MTKEKKSAPREQEQFMLRLPPGMRQQFADIAKHNDRSLNMELVQRLKASLDVPQDIIDACAELGDVHDRLDFAVRIFKRAGFNVVIPGEE